MSSSAPTTTLAIYERQANTSREVELSSDQADFAGWNDLVSGWSIGPIGGGARIELNEPRLRGHKLGLIQAGNHLFLYGRLGDDGGLLPVWRGAGAQAKLMQPIHDRPFEVRFDSAPLWIGDCCVQWKSAPQL